MDLGFWEDIKNKIRTHINNEGVSRFQNWDEIRYTMIANVDDVEYNYLKQSNNWDIWKEKINETVLKPNSHYIEKQSSTNNLHHAYSLQILMENVNCKLTDFDDVVEFGGGYGNMCRLFKNWGHNKPYYIYDIPELIEIQKYYLKENNVDNVHFKSGDDKIDNITSNKNTLFIGLWSISETPIVERMSLLENIRFFECKTIFLALAEVFINKEDNKKWLEENIIPTLEKLGYSWSLDEILHLKQACGTIYYFIAHKNN
jgi:putative sugar O-methyltransferase